MENMSEIAHTPAEDVPDLIMAIGRIAVRHAMLEILICDLLGQLLRLTLKESESVFAHLGLKAKLDMAGSLAHEIQNDGAKKKYLLDILSQADNVSRFRNSFSHQLIGYAKDSEGGLHFYQTIARGKPLQKKITPVSSKDASDAAVQLGKLNYKLMNIVLGSKPWLSDA